MIYFPLKPETLSIKTQPYFKSPLFGNFTPKYSLYTVYYTVLFVWEFPSWYDECLIFFCALEYESFIGRTLCWIHFPIISFSRSLSPPHLSHLWVLMHNYQAHHVFHVRAHLSVFWLVHSETSEWPASMLRINTNLIKNEHTILNPQFFKTIE